MAFGFFIQKSTKFHRAAMGLDIFFLTREQTTVTLGGFRFFHSKIRKIHRAATGLDIFFQQNVKKPL